jgi:hypothetical protein
MPLKMLHYCWKTLVTLTLQQTIDYLNSKILLNFKALDNRYVTVSILNKTIFAALSYLKN